MIILKSAKRSSSNGRSLGRDLLGLFGPRLSVIVGSRCRVPGVGVRRAAAAPLMVPCRLQYSSRGRFVKCREGREARRQTNAEVHSNSRSGSVFRCERIEYQSQNRQQDNTDNASRLLPADDRSSPHRLGYHTTEGIRDARESNKQ